MHVLLFNLATDADDPILGFATHWIGALAKRVDFISVITMRVGRIEVPHNVRVYSVGKEKNYSEPRRAIEFYRHLFHILQKERIDVCFSHMIQLFTILAAPVLKPRNIPIVTWYAHPSLPWSVKLAHHLSDRMVSSIPTAYPYRHNKLTVVGHGIDTDLFSANGSISQAGPPLILCAGRLSPVKDHSTLLKAAWLLRQQRDKPFRVAVVGSPASPRDADYVQSLREQIKELGLEDIVSLEPPVPLESLPPWYQRCTVHVNLTPTGFGDKVAWEAMSCGKPCLVANDGFQGTLGKYTQLLRFRYGDPEDLANKLKALLALREGEREQIGLYLRQQVVQMHSLERLTGNLIGVFQSVISC